jgi:diguanylate cyclase (GGDEF)-like protein
MPLSLPVVFLLVQCAAFWLLPYPLAVKASYIFMVVAPALAALAALRRGLREQASSRLGWFTTALAMGIWALGAFGNLWYEMILHRTDLMYRDSILAFNLAIVPVTFLLASEWNDTGRRLASVIDAVLALALGYGYFLFTWSMLTARGAPDMAGVTTMLWLMDAQNLVVSAGALIRWCAAEDTKEREIFRALSAYTVSYLVVAFVNNHFLAVNPAYGALAGSIVTAVFALVAWFALLPPSPEAGQVHSSRFARAVRSASPLFLAGTLLIVSLFLIRVDYPLGTAGILIAVLGYGLRSTATQVRHIESEDRLQRDHSELQAIAWTDALTGVANRRFLDQALTGSWRNGVRASQPLSVLMIDIDHFKLLNDRYGHPAGDACLREVARVLRHALVRPGDVLARYGGEEFIALLQEADTAGAIVVAERLRTAVQALGIENLGSPLGVVTVSIGSASATLPAGATAVSLVDDADKALYQAKCAGRNQVKTWVAPEHPENAPMQHTVREPLGGTR